MGKDNENYTNTFIPKIYYLGLMVKKLISCYLGKIKPDDRDSYINKRVELPGMLIGKLFKDYFKKMILEC